MSLETVLKNIYTFSQILGQANGKTAGLWDGTALKNAFKWATYCEQIQAQVKNERTKKALDKKLLEMGILLEPQGSVCLSVDLLGQATDLLFTTLLQNVHTSASVLSELNSRRRTREQSLLQKFSDLISTQGAADIPMEVLNFLEEKEIPQHGHNKESKDSSQTLPVVVEQAKLMLQTLAAYSDKPPSEVNHILERISCLKHGWEVLVCMVFIEDRLMEGIYVIRKSMVEWMSRKTPLMLCSVANHIAMQAAKKNSDFFHLYLNGLMELTNQMTAEYHQLTNGRLYSWRHKAKDGNIVFEELIKKFQSLLDCTDTIRRETVSQLTKNAKTSYFNIWRDISCQLH